MLPGLQKLTKVPAIIASMAVLASPGFAEDDPLAPTREKLREAAIALESDGEARPLLLLTSGRHDEARQMVPVLKEGALEDQVLAARVLLAVNELEEARSFIEVLIDEHLDDTSVRRLAYRWWVIVDDLARVD